MTPPDGTGGPPARQRRHKASQVEGLPARQAALEAFTAVLADGVTIDDALEAALGRPALRNLSDRDRGFARAIVVVGFRHYGAIEQRLKKFVRKPLPKGATSLRAILHLGLGQLDHMDVPDHAAVSLTVEVARADPVSRHFVSLVNGVMRAAARDRQPAPGRARTVPAWLWRRWRATYGEMAARAIIEAQGSVSDLDLTVKQDAAGWARRLEGSVLATGSVRLASKAAVPELDGFGDGGWWVQDAAAALPARLLGAGAGKRVLDLCAAPGGKTAQLAHAGAAVTAVDISPKRLQRLKTNLERVGADAELVAADILDWQPGQGYDAILLDAPCSATGTIRRHPEIPYTRSEEDIAALAELQAAMLDRAKTWLKPGGVMVYCTCSLEPEEGEARIEAFLDANPDFRRTPIEAGEIGGLESAVTAEGDVRTLPFMQIEGADRPGLDGFFIARLTRAGGEAG